MSRVEYRGDYIPLGVSGSVYVAIGFGFLLIPGRPSVWEPLPEEIRAWAWILVGAAMLTLHVVRRVSAVVLGLAAALLLERVMSILVHTTFHPGGAWFSLVYYVPLAYVLYIAASSPRKMVVTRDD